MHSGKQGIRNNDKKQSSETEFVIAEPAELLEFLLLHLFGKSRNNVKSLLSHREVSVNGKIITQFDYKLSPGQILRVAPPPGYGQMQKNKNDRLDILYEDSELIVINKPAGLLSIATDTEKTRTAYHLLTEYVKRSNPKARVFAVHRLDRETSGVLMVAKNEKIKQALQNSWAELVSERGYVAIVEGYFEEKSGRIRSWLKETKTMLVYSSPEEGDGLEAVTNYQVIRENKDYSLVRIQLDTGRKNQIRVHMKDKGHPVAGDKKYGAETDPLKRLGLHACKLELEHPFTHQKLCFEAPAPKEFDAFFSSRKLL